MAIPMLKIRRPLGRLIFNMGIAIPGKTVFLIETAPWARDALIDSRLGVWGTRTAGKWYKGFEFNNLDPVVL